MSGPRNSALLNVMAAAAIKAAKGLIRDFGEVEKLQVSKKGTANFVTAADKKSEKLLYDELLKARPDFGFLMEEGGEVKGKDAAYRWIIDPLDGTTNFMHAVTHFNISIAVEKTEKSGAKSIIAGVVYDPIHDELFQAEKNNGAFLNGRRLGVSRREDLETVMMVSGVSRRDLTNPGDTYKAAEAMTRQGVAVRFYGAAALDLAHVAAGRFDGFWHYSLSPWDVAAGMLLVEEAGGKVSALRGATSVLESGHILATNAFIHGRINKLINDAL